ncbi:hypothetical protein KTAU_39610 [Thermogemmatispora aurantia]|uniref:Uncharacterized protein n=1 Tax=Thermogemmatispora aurantia TaxID=2045279 RepID=A0A5J4KIB7_9CHLR|nr:hypothetical protein KTAU_39610 [Thermogemmatispora aurantia]
MNPGEEGGSLLALRQGETLQPLSWYRAPREAKGTGLSVSDGFASHRMGRRVIPSHSALLSCGTVGCCRSGPEARAAAAAGKPLA